jgi:Arc/MetJ-type ribon-helix-helix transcriptional regulator
MRTTKTISISIPPGQLKEMTRTARRENRTMSELIREAYRRYVADNARRELGMAVEALRSEASRTPAGKLSMREIDDEIAAARRARRRNIVATK